MQQKEKEVEILLVEDNPNDIEMTMRALKNNNLTNKVQVARDGEEALDYILARGDFKNRPSKNPKIILLDLKLPKLNGLEVLKEIKSRPETKIIPVIVVTSSKEESDLVQSYRLGANSYIVKPVDFDKFVEAVKDLGIYWLLLNKLPEI